MGFPLAISDVSLWLGITSLILIVTSELLHASPNYSSRIQIDKTRLRFFAVGCGLAFLVTVGLQAFSP